MIKQLEEQGCKVYVTHWRMWEYGGFAQGLATPYEIRSMGHTPAPNGGMTYATIQWPDGRRTHGAAVCSLRDNFCRKIGRNIAVGRAVKARNGRGKN